MRTAAAVHGLSADGGALTRLVGDVPTFEATMWGALPLVTRTGDRDRFGDVWSVEILDDFLTSGLRRPLIRLVEHGQPCDPVSFTTSARLGGRSFDDVIDPQRVADRFAAGATVVAQSLHRACPPVRDFVADLATEISHALQANAYLTPPGGVGLAPHADRHDVFVIQVDGTKRWTVDGLDRFELAAGDVLYIPAGTTHSASGTDVSSLHLTVGVLRVTYRSVIDRILSSGPDILNQPLPLRYRAANGLGADGLGEADDFEQSVERAIRATLDHLDGSDVANVVTAERRRPLSRPPVAGRLRAAVALADSRLDDRILRNGDEWTIEVHDDHVRVVAGDRWLCAPLACRRALEQFDTSTPIEIGALRGLDEPSRIVLARRLVAGGLCDLVPGPPADDPSPQRIVGAPRRPDRCHADR